MNYINLIKKKDTDLDDIIIELNEQTEKNKLLEEQKKLLEQQNEQNKILEQQNDEVNKLLEQQKKLLLEEIIYLGIY